MTRNLKIAAVAAFLAIVFVAVPVAISLCRIASATTFCTHWCWIPSTSTTTPQRSHRASMK